MARRHGSPNPSLLLCARVAQTLLEYRLVLMNNQNHIRLGLSHVPHRQYAPGVQITTVGKSGAGGACLGGSGGFELAGWLLPLCCCGISSQ